MKRLNALCLVLALSLSLFAGCGDSSSSLPPSSTEAPVATATPQPTEAPFDGQPLTGEAKDADYVAERPVAIMINNRSDSRPARGLSQADVLYEIMVEGGITRFMALFPNYQDLGEVGPVRSARDQFFRLVRPFQALYVHIGRSGITQQYMDDNDYGDLDVNGLNVTIATRDDNRLGQGFPVDATAYTTGTMIGNYVDKNNVDMTRALTSPIFDFVNYNESPRTLNGDDAASVNIVHSSSYRTSFTYDEASGKYLTSLYSKAGYTPMVDEANGERIAFENVIVLFTDITNYPYPGGNEHGDPGYKKVDYDFGGLGYYISNGKIEKIRWTKGPTEYPLMLQDEAGNSLKVNCGKSYIAVVSLNEYDNFAYTGLGGDATSGGVQQSSSDAAAAQQAEAAADAADAAD